jgi:hypothetical protein
LGNRIFFNLFLIAWSFTFFTCTPESSNNDDHRGFDQERLAKLNSLDTYNYDREFEQETSNSPVLDIIGQVLSAIAWFFNSLLGYFIIAFLLGLLIWILVKNSDKLFEKKRLGEQEKLIIVQPLDVEDKDYHQLIQAALKKEDFKMAIRFGFLSTLKYLHKKELIEWKIDKTNLDYQFELPENYQETFQGMSLIYERIWYGDFSASKDLFTKMSRKFHDIKNIYCS